MFKGVKQYNLEDHIVFFLENQEGNNLVTHFFLVMAKQNIFHTNTVPRTTIFCSKNSTRSTRSNFSIH